MGLSSLRELEVSKEAMGGPHKGRGEVGLRVEMRRRKLGPEAFAQQIREFGYSRLEEGGCC